MNQNEIFYQYNSVVIAATLFTAIIVIHECGYRIGRIVQKQTDAEVKSLTGSIQGSILGLLALLLGFTFSMSMQRYDSRNLAVIDEANAIGTALLRIELLPENYHVTMRSKFEEYIDLRITLSQIDMTRQDERKVFNEKAGILQSELWALAVQAANEDPRPVTTGAFINSLNAAIDSQGKRNALLQLHVPEVVLLLLFIVFVSSGGMMGYSGGLTGKRVFVPILLVSLLITLIVFIIIDLDRPKRGLIQVNQQPLLELKQS